MTRASHGLGGSSQPNGAGDEHRRYREANPQPRRGEQSA